jgi:hypothetical protein
MSKHLSRANYTDNGLPIDRLWTEDLTVIEDQLYSHRGITDMDYRLAVEHIIEAKTPAAVKPQAKKHST